MLLRSNSLRYVSIGIGLLVLGFFVFSPDKTSVIHNPLTLYPVTNDEILFEGKDNAVIVLYMDLECPYCKQLWFSHIPRIRALYPNLSIAFRHFPLASRPRSLPAALSAECVRIHGTAKDFISFVSTIYEQTPPSGEVSSSLLHTSMSALPIPLRDRVFSCSENNESFDFVEADTIAGAVASVSVTPSIVVSINEEARLVVGSSYTRLIETIELLQRKSKM